MSSLAVAPSFRGVTRFDVVCAGEVALGIEGRALRPTGGAFEAAVALAREGVRVGLAAAVSDDSHGRALIAAARAEGVDASGVSLVAPRGMLVVPDGGDRIVPRRAEDDAPVTVPDAWYGDLLLVTGLTPALVPASALCRAARAARRAGARVLVDVNARPHLWKGHDARTIRALVREADVVRCSTRDLVALWTDVDGLRAFASPDATLVLTEGPGAARAIGPFGEVAVAPPRTFRHALSGAGDAFTASLCVEVARAASIDRIDWVRALERAHAAAAARARRAATSITNHA